MKKEYMSPAIDVISAQLNHEMLGKHSQQWGDAKEQNFEADDQLFNTETRNIWAEEEEEE